MPAVWCEQRDGRGHRPSFLARSCSGIFFLFSFFLKRILSRKARGSCEPAFIRRRATRRLSCLRCCGAPTAGTSATGHLVLGQNSTLFNFTERSRRTSAFLLDFHPLSAPAPSWLHLPAQGIVSLDCFHLASRSPAQQSRPRHLSTRSDRPFLHVDGDEPNESRRWPLGFWPSRAQLSFGRLYTTPDSQLVTG